MRGTWAQTPTPAAYSPEEAEYRDVETNRAQHPKAKGVMEEVSRAGPWFRVAGEGIIENDWIK